jgi:hypothetical protein
MIGFIREYKIATRDDHGLCKHLKSKDAPNAEAGRTQAFNRKEFISLFAQYWLGPATKTNAPIIVPMAMGTLIATQIANPGSATAILPSARCSLHR